MQLTRFWCLCVVVVLIAAGSVYNVVLTGLLWSDHQRNSVVDLASLKCLQIASHIRTSLGALQTLEAMVQLLAPGFVEENFHHIAPTLRGSFKGITRLALAKYGVISAVDPLNISDSLVGYPLLQLLQKEAHDIVLSGRMKASLAWDIDSSVLVVLRPIFAHHASRTLPNDQWTFQGQNYSRNCSGVSSGTQGASHVGSHFSASQPYGSTNDGLAPHELVECSFPHVHDEAGRIAHFWGFAMLMADFQDALETANLPDLEHPSGGWSAAGFTSFAWRLTDLNQQKNVVECESMRGLNLDAFVTVTAETAVPEIGLRWQLELAPLDGWQARDGWWVNTLLAFPVTLVLSVGMGISVMFSLRKRTLDKLKLRKYREGVLFKAVAASIETLEHFQFPLCLISVEDFLACGAYPSYEELRDLGKHVVLDSCWDAEGYYEDAGILLLSYEAAERQTGDASFDPDGSIYKAMVSGIRGLRNYGLKFEWVWAAYSCVPQQNSIQHQCAINSIAGYFSSFKAMLAVQSRKGGGGASFSNSFGSWSRLERLVFLTCQCLDSDDVKVFKYTEKKVLKKEKINRNSAEFAWDIMRGSFKCCSKYHPQGSPCDKQRFVGVILSTYWRLLALERAGGSEVASELVRSLREGSRRYLPPTFAYWSEKGPQTVELFAGLIPVLHEMFAEDSVKSEHERAVVPKIAGPCTYVPDPPLSPVAAALPSREAVLSETF